MNLRMVSIPRQKTAAWAIQKTAIRPRMMAGMFAPRTPKTERQITG